VASVGESGGWRGAHDGLGDMMGGANAGVWMPTGARVLTSYGHDVAWNSPFRVPSPTDRATLSLIIPQTSAS
jgi:hypothetical protein